MSTTPFFNWRISGHELQLKLLESAVLRQKLAHAYIFSGPSQIGKRAVAKKLAQILLCQASQSCETCVHCRTFAVGSNPDYIEISADDAIKIDLVRDLGYKLSLKPYSGKYKVAVINDAHNLTVEAANALLKVLEEPKPLTMMILITDNHHRLLPTISSRAQKINFGPVEDLAFAKWLLDNNYPEPDPVFAGRPGYVVRLASDPDLLAAAVKNGQSLNEYVQGSMGKKMILASELADLETSDLRELFEHWLHRLRSSLKQSPSLTLAGKINSLLRAQKMLDQNVNTKLLLSELMLSTN